MTLKLFRELYESTFKIHPLLADFWATGMFDLIGKTYFCWKDIRAEIENIIAGQQKTLKEIFDAFCPATAAEAAKIGDFSPAALAELLRDYPELLSGNEDKLRNLLKTLRANDEKWQLASILQ